MKRLDVNNKLFLELSTNPPSWWINLVSKKDIYADIRKDNYIDIYYNGGNIIRDLKFDGNNFTGSINYKYLLSDKSEYIKYSFNNQMVLEQNQIKLLSITDFEDISLKRIKANIGKYYSATSEKGIQARFVKNAGCFLDTEFAYIYDKTNLRIDLVWIDLLNLKIVFVELKTMGDSRLYDKKITEQLEKYNNFAREFESEIIYYYQKLFEIKRELDILPFGLKSLSSLSGFTLEKKPLLLFGDCQQEWINNNNKEINERIKDVSVGAYYFGGTKYNCDIIRKSNKNRHIF